MAALLLLTLLGRGKPGHPGPFIGLLELRGVIVDDPERESALRSFTENDMAKALVVRVNSPGGTVVGGESLYEHFQQIAAKGKPVVAVMGELATSAAYMACLGSERIFSRQGTITGSVGVIMQVLQVRELLAKLGVEATVFKSGELKAAPNPIEPITPAVRRATRETIDEMYDIFVTMVVESRGMPRQKVTELADGRIFSGRQAVKLGLVDEIGGETKALGWLAERGVDTSLPLENIIPRRPLEGVLERLVESGFAGIFNGIGEVSPMRTAGLKGLVSLWSPAYYER